MILYAQTSPFEFVSIYIMRVRTLRVQALLLASLSAARAFTGQPTGGLRLNTNRSFCAGSSDLESNAILKTRSLPFFSDIDSSHVKPAIEFDLSTAESDFKAFEASLLGKYIH